MTSGGLYTSMARASNPYGDGHALRNGSLLGFFGSSGQPRSRPNLLAVA